MSIAGLLDIPLATMLGYGLVIGPLTVLITVFLYLQLVKRGLWNPDKDEYASEALLEEEALVAHNSEGGTDERAADSRRSWWPFCRS